MKFQPSRRLFLLVLGVGIVAALCGTAYWGVPRYQQSLKDRALLSRIQANKDAAEAYKTVEERQRELDKDPANIETYISLANNWVLIADILHDQAARDKAIGVYENAVARFDEKHSVLLLNLGNAYRDSGRYQDAERLYRKTIHSNPGLSLGYENLINLYRVNLKKEPADIIPLFQEALDHLFDNARTAQLLAEYYVSIGNIHNALEYYRLLEKKYPSQFSPIIAELEKKS